MAHTCVQCDLLLCLFNLNKYLLDLRVRKLVTISNENNNFVRLRFAPTIFGSEITSIHNIYSIRVTSQSCGFNYS